MSHNFEVHICVPLSIPCSMRCKRRDRVIAIFGGCTCAFHLVLPDRVRFCQKSPYEARRYAAVSSGTFTRRPNASASLSPNGAKDWRCA